MGASKRGHSRRQLKFSLFERSHTIMRRYSFFVRGQLAAVKQATSCNLERPSWWWLSDDVGLTLGSGVGQQQVCPPEVLRRQNLKRNKIVNSRLYYFDKRNTYCYCYLWQLHLTYFTPGASIGAESFGGDFNLASDLEWLNITLAQSVFVHKKCLQIG